LDDDSTQPQYLQTVVGHGYRFVALLSQAETSANSSTGTVSLEELGQAIMAAAGVDPEKRETPPKQPAKS